MGTLLAAKSETLAVELRFGKAKAHRGTDAAKRGGLSTVAVDKVVDGLFGHAVS
jgi:hypothetical protein